MSQERVKAALQGLTTANPDSDTSIISLAQDEEQHLYKVNNITTLASAYLIKLALNDVLIREYAARLMEFTTGLSDELDQAILRVGHVMGWVNEQAALNHIHKKKTDVENVALALYCVMRHPDDFAACIKLAPSPEVAGLAGAIMGARLGIG